MVSIPYALSIQHFINSVGAKAGFASIIGLALLILIFFTQSRETANLRRRADEAEQQLYQLQLYVDHLSRQRTHQAPATAQSTAAPVAAPPAAALAHAGASRLIPGEQVANGDSGAGGGGGGVATLIPAAPAGVGAPALSSATRLIPLADPEADEISIRALRTSTNGDGDHHVPDATVATPPPAPPPSTAAGGGNGVARPPVPVPMPTMANEPAPPPRVALPRQQRSPARPPVAPPPVRRGAREPAGRRLSPLMIILPVILVIAVVAVVLIVTGGSGSGNKKAASRSSSSASVSASSTHAAKASKTGKHKKAATVTVSPSSVTLAVLNGTATNHLAATVLGKLTTTGYKGTFTQNAAETGVTSTIVGYTAPSYRADALAVAKSLSLGSASVQSASQADRLKVCGSTTAACSTQVIVTAGADLASAG